ncbi:unnamed protein product [Mytilus coruscus]|uniref:DDE Tnp4 domain-containing protein n=1 Tax=Mytilus coruscus TaxID=42192 RepID=A0A6J8BEK9_MYTCO|nr:unnamed protein product [Mytilus coruscus]
MYYDKLVLLPKIVAVTSTELYNEDFSACDQNFGGVKFSLLGRLESMKPVRENESKLIGMMRSELQRLTSENLDLKEKLAQAKLTPESLQNNEDKVKHYTGREELRMSMPMEFRKHFGVKVSIIIDCFEFFIERPSNILARAETWSNYKHHNTVKFLTGITPQGAVSFL